ncbi:hypothetical protein BO70DRAFT_361531 [Aspergillus heteromorphus CBS 117.55]|uniref:Uncharacterized protein n=1 Tax=Aspergillus heteromorphus CBS 117.55 TaxID=1448321 RepID=A0A317WA51_9EURO|nr:uncharacterized protein BO70DRAFT_361531 [Aspergillus heteromorphus CBS 117.55]PWY83414.1 hypothetical protein BO70DRAFT_361531 [Aspergillus heteromorphus CBS 117.55]
MSTPPVPPDYSEDYATQPFPLRLFSEYDDENDLWIKQKLESLVKCDVSPTQTALDFDATITQLVLQKHENVMKRALLAPEQRAQGGEEKTNPFTTLPRPRYYIETLLQSIALLAPSFPPHHAGQDAIIDFLKALQALPRHELYSGSPPEDPNEKYPTMTLWALETPEGNWEGFAGYFRHEIISCHPPYRWRNFNSTMARLTASGFADCTLWSALRDILPGSGEYPDLQRRPVDGPIKMGNDINAAAQWVVWPEECRYVYERCRRGEGKNLWCMENWREWKSQFAFVAGDGRFEGKFRDVAGRAARQMVECESEGGESVDG